ncbi:hypothetical protein CJ030_MR7G009243 [Morella rubra]|uniref:Uncharacterized protein n=1 Tax=Morella rubra TaxID=262757 RepID=A0A6A1V009_9ROSI|nr:hypothetical protein CJ030_MR7G009243 [Morella rubra]
MDELRAQGVGDISRMHEEQFGLVLRATTSASKRGRGRTRGVGLEKSLGSGPGNYRCISRRESVEECLPLLPPIDEDWNVGGREDGGRDYDDGTSNAPQPMHAYFKKFPSKEAALLKDITSETFMKRSEQNKKNRSKLTVNHAAGSRSFQRTRACMERMDAFQRQCDLEGKTYTEIEVYLRYWARSRDMFGD